MSTTTKRRKMKYFFCVFLGLFFALFMFSISEKHLADPFAEPYVSHVFKGDSVEVGWPYVFACCKESSDDETGGPWSLWATRAVLEFKWKPLFLNMVVVLLTALSGALVLVSVVYRFRIRLTTKVLLSIMLLVAINLINENRWLFTFPADLLVIIEYICMYWLELLKSFCVYSICFVWYFPLDVYRDWRIRRKLDSDFGDN